MVADFVDISELSPELQLTTIGSRSGWTLGLRWRRGYTDATAILTPLHYGLSRSALLITPALSMAAGQLNDVTSERRSNPQTTEPPKANKLIKGLSRPARHARNRRVITELRLKSS